MKKKFKRLFVLLIVSAVLISSIPSEGIGSLKALAAGIIASGTCGDKNSPDVTWSLDSNGVMTISGSGKTKNVAFNNFNNWGDYKNQIKKVVFGDGITGSEGPLFSVCEELEEAVFGSGFTYISSSFSYCPKLKKVTLGQNVKEIGWCAFSNCVSLANISLPSGVTAIEEYAFQNCTNLQSINIPSTMETIEDYAFDGCHKLVINVPSIQSWLNINFNKYYDFPPLSHCADLAVNGVSAKELVIPSSCTSIPDNAFNGYNKLKSVTISSSVTNVGYKAFYSCSRLETISGGTGVKTLGDYAFARCALLKSASLSNSITSLGSYVFSECVELESVHLPENLNTDICGLFQFCPKLTTVTLPSNITGIGENTFSDCYNLQSLTIPSKVKSIGEYAFFGCEKLKSISLPSSVSEIGNYSFGNCTGLTSFTVPKSTSSIGENTFSGCFGISSVSVESGNTNFVVSFGVLYAADKTKAVFCVRNKTGLITLPDTITKIYQQTFQDCTLITGIFIPDNVYLYTNYFSGCSNLESIFMNSTNTSYSCVNGVLYNSDMTKLIFFPPGKEGSFTLPATVNSVNSEVSFAGLSNIYVDSSNTEFTSDNGILYNSNKTVLECFPGKRTSISGIASTVTSIGLYAFSGSSITSLSLPSSIKTINSYAFSNCEGLTSVTIPDTVTNLSGNAFSDCDNLETITIGSGWNNMNYYSYGLGLFEECPSLKAVNISSSNTKYKSINGVIYSKDGTTLYRCPSNYQAETFTVPSGCSSIYKSAFLNCKNIKTLEVTNDQLTLNTGSSIFGFFGRTYPGKVSFEGRYADITIRCNPDSTAEQYAEYEDFPIEHFLGSWTTVPATCTEDGYKIRTCTGGCCQEKVIIPAHGHDYKKIPEKCVAPTCTANGYDYYECSYDAAHNYKTTVNKTGHNYGNFTYDGEDNKTHTKICNNDSSHIITEACSFTSIIIKNPTCTEEGEKLYTCSICGGTYTESIDPIGHNYQKIDSKCIAPTCTEDGYDYYQCSHNASHNFTIPISCTGHDYGQPEFDGVSKKTHTKTCINDQSHTLTESCKFTSKITKNPTCTEYGEKMYICSVCGGTYTEKINPIGHDYHKIDSKCVAPTCTEDGYDYYECSHNSSHNYKTILNKTGHRWDNGVVEEAISCTKGETVVYTCLNDSSHIRRETSNPKGHTPGSPVNENNVSATCTECGGYDILVRCIVCGDTITSEHVEIPAMGHSLIKTDAKSPSCVKDGNIEYYTCKRCNKIFADSEAKNEISITDTVISKQDMPIALSNNAHDWSGNWVVVKEATIYEDGLEKLCCKNDGNHYLTRIIDKIPSYTATFVVDGETIATVIFPKGTKYINEPDLSPYDKDNYTVDWEDYELKDEDIIIHAVYTAIDPDDITEVITDKTVDSYKDGTATITLSASAMSRTIKLDSKSTKPVDVILVLDQSGSMADKLGRNITKLQALKNCADTFVSKLYENSVATDAQHRVALIGFAYSNNYNFGFKNTGLLVTNNTGFVNYKDAGRYYSDAFLPIASGNAVNPKIKNAVNGLVAEGATSAHHGLEMASHILSSYGNDPSRERIVIFITDGTPTIYGEQANNIRSVVPSAIQFAKDIKDSGAKLYTVGVEEKADPDAKFDRTEDGVTGDNNKASFDFNRFLNIVSSNYPDAEAMNSYGQKENNGYYMAVSDTDNLEQIFSTILVSSVYKTLIFKRASIVDTLSSDFVLTMEQEKALRENLVNEYNLSNSDITVIRNSDNTTTIRIENVPAVKTEKDGRTYYTASITFDCALGNYKAGKYDSNTDEAWAEVEGEKVGYFCKPEKITVNADRNIVVFTIDGETYSIWEGSLGENIVVPETEIAKWNVNEKVKGNYAVYEADEINRSRYNVIWSINSEEITQSYAVGQIIVPPQVSERYGYTFVGWSSDVAYSMPSHDLKYTAVYLPNHVHSFEAEYSYGICTEGITVLSKCTVCGDINETKQPPCEHQYKTIVNSCGKESIETALVCEKCHHSENNILTFEMVKTSGEKTTVIDFTLQKDGTVIQPNQNGIKVMIPWTNDSKDNSDVVVKRLSEDGTEYYYDTCFENGYLVFYADHFSYYIISEKDSTTDTEFKSLNYNQAKCELKGHEHSFYCEASKTTHCFKCSVCENKKDESNHIFINGVCSCGKKDLIRKKEGSQATVTNGFIYGMNYRAGSIDDCISVDTGCTYTCESIGTGSKVDVIVENQVVDTKYIVVFGDVNGDGWYDGMDAVIVNCIINGLLTEDDIGEAAYFAADCNHDGVVDENDYIILRNAGLLRSNIDQTLNEEKLLETSAYVEYLNLIDQTIETEVVEETTDEQINPTVNPFKNIISFVNDFIQIIKSAIAFVVENVMDLSLGLKSK